MPDDPIAERDDMTDEPHWAQLADFATAFTADMARQRLAAEGIPAVVLNDQTGIFGPGFMGASAVGVTVLVPSDKVEEALELVEDLLDTYEGDSE